MRYAAMLTACAITAGCMALTLMWFLRRLARIEAQLRSGKPEKTKAAKAK
jgi:hypothetical protein